jgi:type IV pilus assembly protein PilV
MKGCCQQLRFPGQAGKFCARAQRGVALIECLIALLIVAFGVLGLMGIEAKVINFSTDAEDRSRASLLAGEVASQMWLNGTVNPGTATYTALLASTGGLPNGHVLPPAPVVGTTNSADITVTWQPPKDATVSTLTTRVILP